MPKYSHTARSFTVIPVGHGDRAAVIIVHGGRQQTAVDAAVDRPASVRAPHLAAPRVELQEGAVVRLVEPAVGRRRIFGRQARTRAVARHQQVIARAGAVTYSTTV